MKDDDRIRLRHMLDAAREAVGFAAGHDRSDLEANRMLALSLVKCIEIVGEAASRVSSAAREEVPEIPWPDIVNMRHRLIHVYYDVNLDVLWQTVVEDLPHLILLLEQMLKGEAGDE